MDHYAEDGEIRAAKQLEYSNILLMADFAIIESVICVYLTDGSVKSN
jgi:hypothetical protein